MPVKNLIGMKFGRLTVVEFAGLNKDKKALWKCQCDCEKKSIIIYLAHSLKIGNAKSCGCIKKPGILESNDIVRKRLIENSKRNGDCLEWTKYIPENGYHYGMIYYHQDRKYHSVHRLSYMIFKGEIPEGMCVLHSCDNNKCIEPTHLRLGNKKENRKDAIDRNRLNLPKGSNHHKSKLSEEDVLKIRELRDSGKTLREIGHIFNVHLSMISYICNGKNWKHI